MEAVFSYAFVVGVIAWCAYLAAGLPDNDDEARRPVTFRAWLIWFLVLAGMLAVAFFGAVGEP